MNTQTTPQTTPIIQLVSIDGKATATSIDIANHFGKSHRHVLQAIRDLLAQLPEHHQPNFRLMVYPVQIGSGAIRNDPAYRITRDGFTLLAMGFTGKKALAFKLAYIDAFNDMEEAIRNYHNDEDDQDAQEPLTRSDYTHEAWFACLQANADAMGITALARVLQVSRCTLGRVLNKSVQYADGSDSYPTLVAIRTLKTFFSKKRHQHHAHAIALVRQQQQMGLQF